MNNKDKCVLCFQKLPEDHPGRNNPQPLSETGECCDLCNKTRVLPERFRRVMEKRRNV